MHAHRGTPGHHKHKSAAHAPCGSTNDTPTARTARGGQPRAAVQQFLLGPGALQFGLQQRELGRGLGGHLGSVPAQHMSHGHGDQRMHIVHEKDAK
jgi:hypothetical protein